MSIQLPMVFRSYVCCVAASILVGVLTSKIVAECHQSCTQVDVVCFRLSSTKDCRNNDCWTYHPSHPSCFVCPGSDGKGWCNVPTDPDKPACVKVDDSTAKGERFRTGSPACSTSVPIGEDVWVEAVTCESPIETWDHYIWVCAKLLSE